MPRTPAPSARKPAVFAMYAALALVFVVVAFYTLLHLVFFGFSGEAVGVDFALALVLPLIWIVGLLRAIVTRAKPVVSLAWGFGTVAVLVVILAFDTVRFTPILFG